MKRCIQLAKKGEGFVDPNPLVGTVILKNGKVVGEGYHKEFGKPHAEIEAIKKAGNKTKGATLIVNLEPCCHYGKTPPCTDAIMQSGIKHVVIANTDPNPQVNLNGIKHLKKAGIKVTKNVLSNEGKELNKSYFKWIQKKIPYVSIKFAMSTNGMIAKKDKTPVKLSGQQADKLAHEYRNKNQAILVGINTALSDNPKLTCRLKKKKKRDPLRIIVDSKLRTPRNANAVKNKNYLIATSLSAKKKDIKKWPEENIWISPSKGRVNLKKLLQHLGKRGISSVLVEGGQKIIESFINKKLADHISIFVAQKEIHDGLPWSKDLEKINMKNVSTKRMRNDLIITGLL
jgi:diaminohydroxyphosphoribosylaminopyrimidine deaminase/5-amino-6-(5-phosphoribosylamino)uracil reductase